MRRPSAAGLSWAVAGSASLEQSEQSLWTRFGVCVFPGFGDVWERCGSGDFVDQSYFPLGSPVVNFLELRCFGPFGQKIQTEAPSKKEQERKSEAQKQRVRVLVESENLLQNEAKTLCFTVFFDHQGAEN